ncbi:MAG: hypothetical protein Q8N23_07515 [Archangium sp.]|nr:hypothetical protein [Archangium sp.]MDP3152503.1 hypothetical protein [Archangium sp.]MDP3572327.1 hypothetical protein [Archangium sp.]
MIATFAVWCLAAAPELTFAMPMADPPALNVGVPTTVQFQVRSYGERTAPPPEVSVERVESDDGGVVVGQLNDSGLDGDARAGDGLYGARIELLAKTRTPLRLRAVANVRGARVSSAIIEVPVMPKGAPTGLASTPRKGVIVRVGKGPEFMADELIVCFGEKVAFEAVTQTISTVNGRVTGRFSPQNCYDVELPPTGKPDSALKAIGALQGKRGVVSAEVNGVMRGF